MASPRRPGAQRHDPEGSAPLSSSSSSLLLLLLLLSRPVVLQEQPSLRTRLDDSFLLRFLRARKFDYDRALQLLLNYHAAHKAWPEVFQDLKPSTVQHVLDQGFLTVLPRPDPNGRFILCLRPGGTVCSDRSLLPAPCEG